MTERARTWGLGLWAVAVLGVLAFNMLRPVPGMEDAWPWAGGLMGFPVAAYVVLLRAPGNTIGRLLFALGTLAGAEFALGFVAYVTAPWAPYVESLAIAVSVGIFASIVAILNLFPTGHVLGRTHRYAMWVIAIWVTIATVLAIVAPEPTPYSGRPNPFGIAGPWASAAFEAAFFGVPVFAAMAVVVLMVRMHRAGPVERAQLKWFFAGATALVVTMAVVAFEPVTTGVAENVSAVFAMVSFWSLPAAICIAIIRYRLYDVDRLISRTITYLIVGGVLTLVYAASVLTLTALLPVAGSQLAVAGATLAAAAMFAPVRRLVRDRLDRRFNRARYEAAAVTKNFARRLQREIELGAIEEDLRGVVARTLEPAAVRVWLPSQPGRPRPAGGAEVTAAR